MAEVRSIINSLTLSSQDSVLRTQYQSFSVIQRLSARHEYVAAKLHPQVHGY